MSERTTVITITVTTPRDATDRLTLVVAADYDQAFIDGLKRSVPAYDRAWDEAATVWRVAPQHLALLQVLALGFDAAWLINHDGRRRTDLKTGRAYEQGSLF